MGRIADRAVALQSALKQLQEVLVAFEQIKNGASKDFQRRMMRDSIVKRFELCYDLFWKLLKDHLAAHHGIEANSPKKVFHEAYTQKLLDITQEELLLGMVDDRNLSTHLYSESTIEEITERIPYYYKAIASIANRLQ